MPHQTLQDLQRYTGIQHVHRIGMAERMWRDRDRERHTISGSGGNRLPNPGPDRWARDLGLAGASLRLFPDRWRLGAPSNHTHLALSRQSFEPLRIQRLGQEQHYLGPLNGPELLVVLPEAKAVGSVAMSMLGSDADLGVVLFTSRDASHYQQGQGTQLLHEIALMLPELLERWIERV